MLKNYAVILASGSGSRCGKEVPKQFLKIADKTVLEHTIEAFENCCHIDGIILVINPDYKELAISIIDTKNYTKIIKIVDGGETRKDSSFNGVFSIEEEEANVLIHDCARPLVSSRIIEECVKALEKYSAVGVAIPVTDTIVEVSNGIIQNIPERKNLMCIQTPQCFKLSLIKKAHTLSQADANFTDDCGLIVKNNLAEVFIVNGDSENIKITYPNDICIAEKILQNKTI